MAGLSASNFSRNGVSDWLLQRASAVILAAYTLCVLGFVLSIGELSLAAWRGYFGSFWMQIFTLLALIAYVVHAWIGLWTIATDYLKNTALRMLFQSGFIVVLLAISWTVITTLWQLGA